MFDLFNEIDTSRRQSYALGLSVGLHVVILFLMLFNFSWQTDNFEKSPPALLMVDLTKVKLADKTNLPQKTVQKVKKTPKSVSQPEKEDKTPSVKQESVPTKAEPVKPKEMAAPKDAVNMQEKKVKSNSNSTKKQKDEKVQKNPLSKKKTPVTKITSQKTTTANNLQSLLASVEKVRKPINTTSHQTTITNSSSEQAVTQGIEGGIGGNLTQELTISEKDLIANKIRQCWNINAGIEGADQMIIELRAYVNRDGRIKDVKILNMKNNPAFRSMAESAKRAIYVCDGLQEESPFKILATQHPQTYSSWKELYLRMNPIDGGVF